MTRKFPHLPWIALLAVLALAGCAHEATRPASVADGSTASLTILETTDIHSNVLSFDYYRLQPDPALGLVRAATLIKKARAEYPNHLLFDAGDTIQGTVLADYQALVEPLPCDQKLAVYKMMDAIGYDGATTGNHEYNYGLAYLSRVTGRAMQVDGVPVQHCNGPDYPIVLANVSSTQTGQPIFPPWTIIQRNITATGPDGSRLQAPLSVAIIGFTPPHIMQWDKQHLDGKLRVTGLVEAAKKYLPQIKAAQPDLIVAIVHGGLSRADYSADMANAVNWLAQVPGFDAILMGHMHTLFPGPDFKGIPGVDDQRGTVHGVPAVMGGLFGKDIGLVHLQLTWRDGGWHSDAGAACSETWPICPQKGDCVAPDPELADLVADVQQGAIRYVKTPIGRTDFHLSSYFVDLGDMTALAPVNAAQRAYVKKLIAEKYPELAGIPVLSAAAGFRTGYAAPDDYTDVPAGQLTIRNAADLYYYPNTLVAVQIDGAGLKAWLEHAAIRFNRIDPDDSEPQQLINASFPGYDLDQLSGAGLHYVVDVSQPVGQRITALTVDGKPVAPGQPFLVVTNNYRASGGGGFPGLDGSSIVLSPQVSNRKVLIDWIKTQPALQRGQFLLHSWAFAPLDTRGQVTFVSASDKLDAARAGGLDFVHLLKDNGDGTSTYGVDLSGTL